MNANMRYALIAILLPGALMSGAMGCALFSGDRRPDGQTPPSSPKIEAMDRAFAVIEEARREALEDTERERSYVVKVRYNPGRCGAPSEEVFAYGNWQRVALVGRNERVELTVSEWRSRAQDEPLRHQKVEGRWDEREWIAASGVVWPVFRVDTLLQAEEARAATSEGEEVGAPGKETGSARRFASLNPCTP